MQLLGALADRFEATGEPRDLTFYNETGFGNWRRAPPASVSSPPAAPKPWCSATTHHARHGENGYGEHGGGLQPAAGHHVHLVREAARKAPCYITRSGVNLFVDPKYGGSKLNALATEDWVPPWRSRGAVSQV
jgi:acyl CoA:acetate/3-ketoacid CoA transferase